MLIWQTAGATHAGHVRPDNEDAFYTATGEAGATALLLVADGMGGHAGGHVASRIAVDTARELLAPLLEKKPGEEETERLLGQAFTLANRLIREAAERNPSLVGMGTTLVAALLRGHHCCLAHVGDSRAYRVNAGGAECLTRDHTLVQQLVDREALTPAEAAVAPMRNVLIRALGTEQEVTADISRLSLAGTDWLLLCSDGLPETLPEPRWAPLLAGRTPEEAARLLLEAGLEGPARDNLTLALAACTDDN